MIWVVRMVLLNEQVERYGDLFEAMGRSLQSTFRIHEHIKTKLVVDMYPPSSRDNTRRWATLMAAQIESRANINAVAAPEWDPR